MTLDELDRLHAAAWKGPWTAETWEVECNPGWSFDGCPTGDDCEGSHDCETILAPDAYPDGQVVAQTSHADGRIGAPGLAQFAAANTASIVALHNAWPAISARIRAADVDAANLRVMLDRALGENVGLRAECERLRAALRSVLAEHDGMHDDDCDVRGMSTGDDGVSHNAWGEERRCTCGSTGSRNVARAALGEP